MTLSDRIIYLDQRHSIRYDRRNLIGHCLSPPVSLVCVIANSQPLYKTMKLRNQHVCYSHQDPLQAPRCTIEIDFRFCNSKII
jgi:hypothetical protein